MPLVHEGVAKQQLDHVRGVAIHRLEGLAGAGAGARGHRQLAFGSG